MTIIKWRKIQSFVIREIVGERVIQPPRTADFKGWQIWTEVEHFKRKIIVCDKNKLNYSDKSNII